MKKKNIKKWIAGMMLPVTAFSAFSVVALSANSNKVNAMYIDKSYSNGVIGIGGYHYDDMDYDYESVKVSDTHSSRQECYDEYDCYTINEYRIKPGKHTVSFTISQASSNTSIVAKFNYVRKGYSGMQTIDLHSSAVKAGDKIQFSFETPSNMVTDDNAYVTIEGRRSGGPYENSENGYYGSFILNISNLLLVDADEIAPALETQVFLTDVDNPMTLEYILSQVEFRDEVDGVLTPIVVKDNYSSNKNTVGKYTIEVKATDKAGNTGTGNIEVWVQDKTSPLITGKSTFTSNMSNPLSEASIRSQLIANDNVEGNISNKIQVVSDGFTGNENKKGTYIIKYKVVDTAGNESAVYTVTVSSVDDVKPVISVKDGYSDTYTTSYKTEVSLDTILEGLQATDNVDGNLNLEVIEDKYTGNTSIPGTYTISVRSIDSAGNISEVKVITINVTDEIPPVFYSSNLFIGVSEAQTLSHQDIVNILIYMQGLQNEGAAVQMVSNEYIVDQINEPGVYKMSYRIMREDGEVSEIQTAEIKVLGEKEVVENDTQTQIKQQTKNFFQNAWDWIKDFFSTFWNWIVKYIFFGWAWNKK